MNNCFLFLAILLSSNFIALIHSENSYYLVAILRKKTDKNYDDESQRVQNKIDELVNERMNDIYNVIEEKRDSYILENGELDSKLEELDSLPLEKRNNQRKKFLFANKSLRKRSLSNADNSTLEYIPFESELVNHVAPILNYYSISAYLSEETSKIVCNMDNVLYCEKSKALKFNDDFQTYKSVEMSTDKKKNSEYYNVEAIKKETGWSDVNVQKVKFSPNHLSSISQSPYYYKNSTFDNAYYYPSSAGKGIDIFIIDVGLMVDHEDFDTYEGTPYNRTISCDAICREKGIDELSGEEKRSCSIGTNDYPEHGIMVSSLAGGAIYGVAKKSNIHMLAYDNTNIGNLRALRYVLDHGKPHKTVVSMSLAWNDYVQSIDDILSQLIEKGIIVIVCASNEDINCCAKKDEKTFYTYTGYRKAITVGATDTNTYNHGYMKSFFSNYGDCVDVFAPGFVTSAKLEGGSTTANSSSRGTSCSTPLVAGVAALIMSENSEIEYDNEKMRETLINMSIKGAITNLKYMGSADTPNRFINNGKKSIYSPDNKNIECGKDKSCSNGCCSKDGECISFQNDPWNACLIENRCQSEFGYCTTIEKSINECKEELKEYEECIIDISDDMNQKELYEKYKVYTTDKCEAFYKLHYSNQSVCTVAKKYKSFGFIDDFDREKYLKYVNILNYKLFMNDINSYSECFVPSIVKMNDDEKKEKCKFVESSKCQNFYNYLNGGYINENKYYKIPSAIKEKIFNNKKNLMKECNKKCYNKILDYPCCYKTDKIDTTDKDGNWGIENGNYCFMIPKYEKCWSEPLGFPCCQNYTIISYADSNGYWGVENNNWCGIM